MSRQPNILELIKAGKCSHFIHECREYSQSIVRHTKKEGLDTFLAQINGYENKEQHALRKKFAISNKFLCEELLRPADNVWNARGGSFDIVSSSDNTRNQFFDIANTAWQESSIHDFVKTMWQEAFIEDPNALIFLNLDTDKQKYYPKIVRSKGILDYSLTGMHPDYILFEPIERTGPAGDIEYLYVYITSDQITHYLKKGGLVSIEDQYSNPMGFVPAVVVSNIIGTSEGIRLSPIDSQIELLDAFVRKNSVKEIFEFLHGYPKYWQYGEVCTECNGQGSIPNDTAEPGTFMKCPKCNGSGQPGSKTDVSDVTLLRIPSDDQVKLANSPMGFEVPPVDSWQEMRVELDWMFQWVFRSHWGTSVQKGTNETATGRFIDIQPVNNRLTKYSDAAEGIENALYKFLVRLLFPNTISKARRQFGRRYIIESPDAALTRYKDAKSSGLPTTLLDYLLEQYYSSEFAADETSFNRKVKLSKVEPFIHFTVTEVTAMPIPEELKQQKSIFSVFSSQLTGDDIDVLTIEQLKDRLKEFANKSFTKPQ